MSGCQTCGGFGMHHDPIAHGWIPEPVEQVTHLPQHACRHDWESHPQTDDGHAHDWHMVIIQPWGARHPEHTEAMTVCRVCTAPRCGHTFDEDPCVERRHHRGLHIYESGRFSAQSGMAVGDEE